MHDAKSSICHWSGRSETSGQTESSFSAGDGNENFISRFNIGCQMAARVVRKWWVEH
jgi:hypothetical protein